MRTMVTRKAAVTVTTPALLLHSVVVICCPSRALSPACPSGLPTLRLSGPQPPQALQPEPGQGEAPLSPWSCPRSHLLHAEQQTPSTEEADDRHWVPRGDERDRPPSGKSRPSFACRKERRGSFSSSLCWRSFKDTPSPSGQSPDPSLYDCLFILPPATPHRHPQTPGCLLLPASPRPAPVLPWGLTSASGL